MAAVRERAREIPERAPHEQEGQGRDWRAVIAAHLVDDWPPPEWLAAGAEKTLSFSNA